jgi:epsilon-lactone hydrolase
MTDQEPGQRQWTYEIRVRGHLGGKLLRAFPAFAVRTRDRDTVLTGCLPDQAAIYGAIARLEALGLELIEFRRLPG